MNTTKLTLDEIYKLALKTLKLNGCDDFNAEAVADTVTNALKVYARPIEERTRNLHQFRSCIKIGVNSSVLNSYR